MSNVECMGLDGAVAAQEDVISTSSRSHQRLRVAAGLLCPVGLILGMLALPEFRHIGQSFEVDTIDSAPTRALWQRSCPTTEVDVNNLRQQTYPNPSPPPAPKLSRVLYINLDWDGKRRAYMENQFKTESPKWKSDPKHPVIFEWKRMSAVNASQMSTEPQYAQWRSKGFAETKHPLVKGSWPIAAVAYSHYLAIKMMKGLKAEMLAKNELTIISEDDVEYKEDIMAIWDQIWPYVPKDWDVLRIGWAGDYSNCTQVVNDHFDRAGWRDDPPDGPCMYCGAQAYVVNPNSFDRVLARFENSKMTHSDTLLGAPTPPLEDPTNVPPLNVFVSWPMLAQTHFNKDGYPAFTTDRRNHPEKPIQVKVVAPPPPPPVVPDYMKAAVAKQRKQEQEALKKQQATTG